MTMQGGIVQPSLRNQLEAIAGDRPELQASHTVREAAQEYIVGRHLAAQDQYGSALAHFRRAAELDDKAAAPWIGMAISLSAIGRMDTSIAAWKEVLKRDPSHGGAQFFLGLDATNIGDYETACVLLSQRWLQQKDSPVRSLLRNAAMITAFNAVGKSDVVQLLREESGPIFQEASRQLVSEAGIGTWLAVFQQLIDVDATPVALRLAAGSAPLVKQRIRSSILTTLPVLEAATDGDGSLTRTVYEEVAKSQGGRLFLSQRDSVTLAEALSLAAQSMSVLGAVDAPVALYEASLALAPDNSLALNNLGWLRLVRDGPTEEVVAICERAFELDPTAPYILDTVGWMHMLQGNTNLAVHHLNEAVTNSQRPSPETYDHLGDAHWTLGQEDNAIKAWKTAATLLHSHELRQAAIDGYSSLAFSIWGISVSTAEALYDLEVGEVTRRLEKKLTAVEEGRNPLADFTGEIPIGAN